jgi:hypothetical protein
MLVIVRRNMGIRIVALDDVSENFEISYLLVWSKCVVHPQVKGAISYVAPNLYVFVMYIGVYPENICTKSLVHWFYKFVICLLYRCI